MAQENQVYCTHCGAKGNADDLFCRQCGRRRSNLESQDTTPGASVYSPLRQDTTSSYPGATDTAGKRWEAPPPPEPGLLSGPQRQYGSGFPGVNMPVPGGQRVQAPSQAGQSLSPFHQTLSLSGLPTPGSLAAPPPLMPVLIACSVCSRPLPPGSDRCGFCGAGRALAPAGACFRCGAGNPASNRYCGRCGGLLVPNALSSQRPSSSALPVVGSIILPGLGQMMNGEALKGFMLLGAALLMISQGATIFTLPYLLITAIAAVDAAVSRSRRERGLQRAQDWA